MISADHPTDEYLDYTRGETMKTLEPYWRKAIAEGKPIAFTSEAGARFFLGRLSTDELLKMKRNAARSTSSCSSARASARSSAARRWPTWRSSTRSPS